MHTSRWEYKLIDAVAKSGAVFRSTSSTNIEAYLTALGRQGWEVAALNFFDMRGAFRGVLKRPLGAHTGVPDSAAAGVSTVGSEERIDESMGASTISLSTRPESALEISVDAAEVVCTKLQDSGDQRHVYPADSARAIAIAAESAAFLDRIEAIVSDGELPSLFN